MATTNISKKRKFVADGVFYAELNEVCVGALSWTSAVMGGGAPRPIANVLVCVPCSPPHLLLPTNTNTQLLTRELAEDGYAGVEVRVVPLRTEIIIRATRTQNVLGEKGQRIRELTTVIQKRCVLRAAGWG